MMHIKIKDGHPKTFLVNSFQNGDPHRVEITKTHGPFRCGMMPRRPEQTEGLLSASGMRHGIHGTPQPLEEHDDRYPRGLGYPHQKRV